MIQIEIHNAVSQVICDAPLYKAISDCLSYQMPGSEFAMQGRRGWDGRVRLLRAGGWFPTGLLSRLKTLLDAEGVEFTFKDKRLNVPGCKALPLASWFKARPYQDAAAEITNKISRGVYVIGTGGGKTMTAGQIISMRQVPTLFVTPDKGLREQTANVFRGLLGKSNIGTSLDSKAPVIVSNIQSLIRHKPTKKLNPFSRFGQLMIDEFHHGAAKSYLAVNKWCDHAFYRYGFTGTFTRPDGADMTMHGVLSKVIYKKSTSELIEEGWLVRPHITITRYEVKGWSKLNYAAAYSAIIQDPGFNGIVANDARGAIDRGRQTLVLVRRKEHGELLNNMIDDSVYLSGDDDIEHREYVIHQFVTRKIPCMVATNIFGEGTDIPLIESLVNARCQKTEIQTKQGIGRALRKAKGKKYAEVFDYLIVGQKHLKAHSVERIMAYKQEPAFKILVRR
jgi:superfamily II DNA or RNA helicase